MGFGPWDPFTFSGYSFVGEMQTGAFYPRYTFFLAIPEWSKYSNILRIRDLR